MNLKNNEFVVSLVSHNTYLWAVTNLGRLFYKDGTNWVLGISNGT